MNVGSICMHCMQASIDENGICTKCGNAEADIEINPRHLPLGTIVKGKYLIGKVIGEGGFGITYVAFDLDLELRVAIKEYCPREFAGRDTTDGVTLLPFDTETKEFYQNEMTKFVGEAKRLAKFRGLKGIVSVLDYFMENGTAYIVMEYIDGTTLKDFLKVTKSPMPVQTVFALMEPVISALEQVHKEDVIHRDISPDNIMMSKDYKEIYLIDFGTARNINLAEEHSLSVYKKSSYTPPEQQDRHGNQGPWTDVYALCATIYYCITGKLIPEAVSRLLNDQVKRPSELGITMDSYMEKALMKGLELRIENRFQSMEEFKNALYHPTTNEIEDVGNADSKITESVERKTSVIPQEPNPFERTYSTENTKKNGGKGKKVALFLVAVIAVLGIAAGMISYSKCEETRSVSNYISGAGLEYSYVRVEQEYTLTFLGNNRQLIEEKIYAGDRLVETRTYTDEEVVCTFEDGSRGIYTKFDYGYSSCSYERKSADGQLLETKKWNNGWFTVRDEGFKREVLENERISEHISYEYLDLDTLCITDHISGQRTLQKNTYLGGLCTEIYNSDNLLLEKQQISPWDELIIHERYDYDRKDRVSVFEELVSGRRIEYEYFDDRVVEKETKNGNFVDDRVMLFNITKEPIILHYNEDDILKTIEGDQEAYLEAKKAEATKKYSDSYVAAGYHSLQRDAAADKAAEKILAYYLKNGLDKLENASYLVGERGCYTYYFEPLDDLSPLLYHAENDNIDEKPGCKYHRRIGIAITQVEDGWMPLTVFME